VVGFVCYQAMLKLIQMNIGKFILTRFPALLIFYFGPGKYGNRPARIYNNGARYFLEPYNTGLADVDKEFQILQNLTKDNIVQQKNLDQMKPLIDAKIADMQNNISLRKNSGFPAAQANVSNDTGKQIMDSIRVIVANMQTEEAGLLQIRTKDLAQSKLYGRINNYLGMRNRIFIYLLVNYIIINL